MLGNIECLFSVTKEKCFDTCGFIKNINSLTLALLKEIDLMNRIYSKKNVQE